ncbi:hypothetical protein EFP84_06605 [Leptospira kmetyi]|uniref:Uncharacterized protein n=1 Tax=Leptospira kmetyi TaxID=408139 RepID=A0AAD0US49_9LEPT|nr:hypothetical protein EFP84_06605 [Leptospira kmetyi]
MLSIYLIVIQTLFASMNRLFVSLSLKIFSLYFSIIFNNLNLLKIVSSFNNFDSIVFKLTRKTSLKTIPFKGDLFLNDE